MNKAIPILPCINVKMQIEFYTQLGFEIVGQYPRGYLVVKYKDLELHFYSVSKLIPQENASMCFILADDLEEIYNAFIANFKVKNSKIPRSGFPRISKIRDLSEDRRFTLTDPSGNTLYVGARKIKEDIIFFRHLENEVYAEKFAVLYDLVYSKEDFIVANNLLKKLLFQKDDLNDLDRAKLLLIALEIQIGLGEKPNDEEIKALITENQGDLKWKCINEKFNDIF